MGEKSVNLIKKIAFNHLKMNRLEVYIAKDNKRSISLFEKCGFNKEGILRQYLNSEGNFHDAVIIACIRIKIS